MTAAAALLVLLAACQPRPAPSTPAGVATAPTPLLVTIVIDQLAAWIADERWPLLPADGGFARLRREGVYVRELRYQHAVTDTAPGHAALYTGLSPRKNGIVANEIIVEGTATSRAITTDGQTQLVGVSAGVTSRPGSSLARLRVETIADVFKRVVPGAQVFSFSLKDRGALFGGGRRPDAVLWFDAELGEFVTSTAFAGRLPPGLARAGDRTAVAAAMVDVWDLSAPARAWLAAHAQTPDDQPGEGDYNGLGTVFPHPIRSVKAMRATPVADGLLFGLARAALTEAAANRRPTMLSVSLSSHDYVAHIFGPHSWEAWEELRLLDQQLAGLLTALDGAAGPRGYAVLLTADHGSSPLPELVAPAFDPWCPATKGSADRWERRCGERRRIKQVDVIAVLESTLKALLGPGPWVAGIGDPLVFLTGPGRALPNARRAQLVAAARRALAPMGVEDVIDVRTEVARCPPPDTSVAALVCASTRADQPGDLYLMVSPGVFLDPGYAGGFMTSHGSPYLYDRAVPLLVRAPGRVPAGQVIDRPLSYATFARTAASLLGLPPLAGVGGEDLTR